MATTAQPTTEIAMRLRLTQQAKDKLAEQAARSGRPLDEVASELLEQAVARPSVDELLAPFRKQVAESGMSDEELDDFHRRLLQEVRAEKKAKKTA